MNYKVRKRSKETFSLTRVGSLIPLSFGLLLFCIVDYNRSFISVLSSNKRFSTSKLYRFECAEKNYSWVNSKITFDHVGHAYLALFQVITIFFHDLLLKV